MPSTNLHAAIRIASHDTRITFASTTRPTHSRLHALSACSRICCVPPRSEPVAMDQYESLQDLPAARPAIDGPPRSGRPPQVPRLQLQPPQPPQHHTTAAPHTANVSEMASAEHRSASAPVSEGSLTHRSSEWGGAGLSSCSVISTTASAMRRPGYTGDHLLKIPSLPTVRRPSETFGTTMHACLPAHSVREAAPHG